MRWVAFFCLFTKFLFAIEGYISVSPHVETPWLTGPLLAGSGNVVPRGIWNIEPYFFATARTAFYDNNWNAQSEPTLWSLNTRVPIWIGLTKWLELKIEPGWSWNEQEGERSGALNDSLIQLGFQLHRDQLPHKYWYPSIKLTIQEIVPTGKYRNLTPQKLRTDIGGLGSWQTLIGMNFSKILYFGGYHFLNTCLNLQWSLPAPVHIKGFNVFGGGYGTNGTAYPEKMFRVDLGFEYSFTRRWTAALDILALRFTKSRFSGTPGITLEGLPANNTNKFRIQYSLAPALEYNWSESLGVIAGCWFSIAGKNAPKFASGVVALNYLN